MNFDSLKMASPGYKRLASWVGVGFVKSGLLVRAGLVDQDCLRRLD